MAAHYNEKLTLSEFSRVVTFSSRHLSRRFKADTGLTLFDYLRRYRMFRASVLLSSTELQVSEIGFKVGYDSLSSFYKDFKSLFSLPPQIFRNCRQDIFYT